MSQVRVLYRPPFRKNAIHSGCVFLCPQFLTGNGVLYPSTRRELVKQVRPQKFCLSKSFWGGQRSTSVVARSTSEDCNATHFCNSKKQGGQSCSACHKKYKLQKSFCFFADFCKQAKNRHYFDFFRFSSTKNLKPKSSKSSTLITGDFITLFLSALGGFL